MYDRKVKLMDKISNNIPPTMKAFLLKGHGGFDQLVLEQIATPVIKDNDVLIKVGACGLNNTDINTRTGWYSKTVEEGTTGSNLESAKNEDSSWDGNDIQLPRIQGADIVGHIVALGKHVDGGLLGKRVLVEPWLRNFGPNGENDAWGYLGSECDGGYSQYTAIDHRQVYPIDSSLCDSELATFATSYVTAENMISQANVGPKDKVLITGGSGGVGSALIQLCQRRGATVIAMASSAKHAAMEQIVNPDFLLPRSCPNLCKTLKETTGSEQVDVVLDAVGGEMWPQLIDALARFGRYSCSGAIAGPIVRFDLRRFYLNNLVFTGATIVPFGMFGNLVSYIEHSEIKPLLAKTYKFEDLHIAQQDFIDKKHIGNLVIDMNA